MPRRSFKDMGEHVTVFGNKIYKHTTELQVYFFLRPTLVN